MNVLKIKFWLRIEKPIIEPVIFVGKQLENADISDDALNKYIAILEGVAQMLTNYSRDFKAYEVDSVYCKPIAPLIKENSTRADTYSAAVSYYNYISERGAKIIKLALDKYPSVVYQSQEPS